MKDSSQNNQNKSRRLAFLLILIISIGVFFWLHSLAGLSFPVPWEDEAVFVMQGKALADHGSMFSPSLNPNRVVEWMPPGYMIFLGGVLRFPGNILFLSRLASFLLVILVFLLLAYTIWKKTKHAWLTLILIALYMTSRYFIMAGNMARMEALVLALITIAIYCFTAKKPFIALAILTLTPIVHPNGLYFFIAGVLYFFSTEKFSLKNISTLTVLIWFLVFGAWLAYGIHIIQHWVDFKFDMTQQMERKAGRNFWEAVKQTKYIFGFTAIVLAGVYSWLKKEKWLLMLVYFAGASLFINRVGQEMWYEVYDSFAFILLCIVILYIVYSFNSKVMTVIGLVLVIAIGFKSGAIEKSLDYRRDINFNGLRLSDSVPYIQQSDIQRVREYILSQRKNSTKIRVKFEPRGDALLFQNPEDSLIAPIHVHKEKTMFPDQDCDLYIVHVSKYFPPVWSTYPVQWALNNAGINPTEKKYEILRRNETEVWYANVAIPRNQ